MLMLEGQTCSLHRAFTTRIGRVCGEETSGVLCVMFDVDSGGDGLIMDFTDQNRSQDTRKGCPYHGWTGAVGGKVGRLGARTQDTRKGCPYHGWTGARGGGELGKWTRLGKHYRCCLGKFIIA